MTTRKGFGWEPEFPDHRDFKLSAAPRVAKATIPTTFSMREFCSPVRDQGRLGSCVGFSICAAIELLRRRDADEHSTIYSPLFAYYHARVADGLEWKGVDAGAYIRDGAKIAAKIGVPPESKWKYDISRFAETPHKTAMKEAARWKSGPYYRCTMLDEIIRAIATGYPVVGGFSCFENLFRPEVDRSGDIPMPSGSFQGGHAVCFVGYDLNTRRLILRNSWGESWGSGGYGTLPFDYVTEGLATDFWAISSESPETRQDRPLS